MSVASGVEFGDACSAASGQLPQVIGNIHAAIGRGTITRANGTAVDVIVGDPVYRGDVIETAADGWIEIRFVDGTVFSLSRDSRVLLGEFETNSNGALRSGLFAVTRGTFAFVAGRLAEAGSLCVDTPVGSIRGRAYSGGIGMLWLTALTFALLKEAHAAAPDVTFLDDDNVAYKDFAHGVFELVTKEAIPRHIIVEDPGETIVLTRKGSSFTVNHVANSPTRMEELQTAQQDVLENFAKGVDGHGSSSPPSLVNPDLQPINFIQDDSAQPLGSLVPLVPAVFTVPETFLVHAPPALSITSIAGQIGVAATDIINASEADSGVEITGTTSGVENGQVVTVIIVDSSNHVVYSSTTTVLNNSWMVNLSPSEAKSLADGLYKLTADVSNTFGDPADASRTIRVDETPPTITIDTIARSNVVNVNAADAGFAIGGTVSDAENGQPVTVRIIDSSGQIVDTFTTKLTNNAWSVDISPTDAKLLHDGSYTVTADVSDTAGNPATEARQALTVDETPPKVTWSAQTESGIEGATIVLGTISATVNSLPGHSNNLQSLVVSGIPVGAVLTDSTNSFTATSGDTSIDVKGWNLSNLKIIAPNDTNFVLTVTATDQDANTASASELIKVAPETPALNPVAAHGNEDTAIALDLGVTVKSLSGANGDASPNSLDTLVVSNIPVGATLSDGTGLPGHSFTATAGNTSYDVASWSLSSLKITPPQGFEGCFTLTIAASERDSEGNVSATVTATEVVTVAPVAEPPTASAPATATTAENTAVDISGVVVGPPAENADDKVIAVLTVAHGALSVSPAAGVTETVNCPGSLTVSGTASAVKAALASLVYTPTSCFFGCDTLHVSVTSEDGRDIYPTQATATTAITVTPDSESLIVGSHGPTLDWNDAANWNARIVPTLSIDTTINASCDYTVVIAGAPHAQAESLTIPHGAASVDIAATGTLQLAGDLHVSYAAKLENDGTLEETANATFIGPITNDGTIVVDPNVHLRETGAITGVGNFLIESGTTLEFAAGSKVALGAADSQTIYFEQGAGKLVIDDCGKFDGVITGTAIGAHLTPTDLIDLSQLPYVGGSMSVSISYNSSANVSTMTFSDGVSANNVTLHLSGNYTGTTWYFAAVNGGAGTEIYDPPADSGTVSSAAEQVAVASAAQAVAMGTDSTRAEAFHFNDENSGSGGSGVIDVAEGRDSQAGSSHHADTAGTQGLQATAEGGEAPGTSGDSFHFRSELSSLKGSGVVDVAETHQIAMSTVHYDNSAATAASPAISDAAHAIELLSSEQHPNDPFNAIPGHEPSAPAAHMQHDLIV